MEYKQIFSTNTNNYTNNSQQVCCGTQKTLITSTFNLRSASDAFVADSSESLIVKDSFTIYVERKRIEGGDHFSGSDDPSYRYLGVLDRHQACIQAKSAYSRNPNDHSKSIYKATVQAYRNWKFDLKQGRLAVEKGLVKLISFPSKCEYVSDAKTLKLEGCCLALAGAVYNGILSLHEAINRKDQFNLIEHRLLSGDYMMVPETASYYMDLFKLFEIAFPGESISLHAKPSDFPDVYYFDLDYCPDDFSLYGSDLSTLSRYIFHGSHVYYNPYAVEFQVSNKNSISDDSFYGSDEDSRPYIYKGECIKSGVIRKDGYKDSWILTILHWITLRPLALRDGQFMYLYRGWFDVLVWYFTSLFHNYLLLFLSEFLVRTLATSNFLSWFLTFVIRSKGDGLISETLELITYNYRLPIGGSFRGSIMLFPSERDWINTALCYTYMIIIIIQLYVPFCCLAWMFMYWRRTISYKTYFIKEYMEEQRRYNGRTWKSILVGYALQILEMRWLVRLIISIFIPAQVASVLFGAVNCAFGQGCDKTKLSSCKYCQNKLCDDHIKSQLHNCAPGCSSCGVKQPQICHYCNTFFCKSCVKNHKCKVCVTDLKKVFPTVQYTLTKPHLVSIGIQHDTEKLGKAQNQSVYTYWMPTIGYCPYTVALTYLAFQDLSCDSLFSRTVNIRALVRKMCKELQAPASDPTDVDASGAVVVFPKLANFKDNCLTGYSTDYPSTFTDLIKSIVKELNCKDSSTLNSDEVLDLFKTLCIEPYADGKGGVVISQPDSKGVYHFGYRSTFEPMPYATPTALCSYHTFQNNKYIEDLFKKSPYYTQSSIRDSFVQFITNFRLFAPSVDNMVLLDELSVFLKTIGASYTLLVETNRTIRKYQSNGKKTTFNVILRDNHFEIATAADLDGALSDSESAGFDIISLTSEKSKPGIEEDLTERAKDVYSQITKFQQDYSIYNPKVQYDTKGYWLSYHWDSDFQLHMSANCGTQIFVSAGDKDIQMVFNGRREHFPLTKGSFADDIVHYESHHFRMVSFLRFHHFVICVRVKISPDYYFLDQGISRYHLKVRGSKSDSHNAIFYDWYHSGTNNVLCRDDPTKALRAVSLYISGASKVPASLDWLANVMIKYNDMFRKSVRNHSAMLNGDYALAAAEKEEDDYIQLVGRTIDMIVDDFGRKGSSILNFLLAILVIGAQFCYFVFEVDSFLKLASFVFFQSLAFGWLSYELSRLYITRTITKRDISREDVFGKITSHTRSVVDRTLSIKKKFELMASSLNFGASLQGIKFFDGVFELTKNQFIRKWWNDDREKPLPVVFNDKKFSEENHKYLPGYAPRSVISLLWAALKRQTNDGYRCNPMNNNMIINDGYAEKIAKDILFQAKKHPELLISRKDYIEKVVIPSKRKLYQTASDRFDAKPKMSNRIKMFAKPDEKQHKKGATRFDSDGNKPRSICGPDDVVKAVGGHIMYVILQLTKLIPDFGSSIMCGKTPEELRSALLKAFRSVKDRVTFKCDGARWDSTQNIHALALDIKILKIVVEPIALMLGYSGTEIKAILYNLTCLLTEVEIASCNKNMPRGSRWQRLCVFKMRGTVYSGHPARTTWGNTLRGIVFFHKISVLIGAHWNKDFFHFQAGDDVFIVFDKKYEAAFKSSFSYFNSPAGSFGYFFTDAEYNYNDIGDFLSLLIFYDCGDVFMRKLPFRYMATGCHTTKVSEDWIDEYDCAITKQLESYDVCTGSDSHIAWRKAREAKTCTKQMDHLAKNDYNMINLTSDSNKNGRCCHKDGVDYRNLDAMQGDPVTLLSRMHHS